MNIYKALKSNLSLATTHECARCVNTTANPTIKLNGLGLCQVCANYDHRFDAKHLAKEREFFKKFIGQRGKSGRYDVMVGISGGKDSTATLSAIKDLGFTPLAFTFDTGYYPKQNLPRAKSAARSLGVDHVVIDIRSYARAVDLKCFKLSAQLYDSVKEQGAAEKFRKAYAEGRRHYSARCKHALPFVRSCQLCRRLVIRGYYGEAAKRGIGLVVLGMNEWAGLSRGRYTGLRRLKPFKKGPAVTVAHFPFLFRRTIKDTRATLKRLGWKLPKGESLIESNANSCLFARAAEAAAARLLGFHPDTTRLAREVTAGFITKKQALAALARPHTYKKSVRQVLAEAGLVPGTKRKPLSSKQ